MSASNISHSYVNTLTLLPLPFSYTPSLKSKPKAPNSTLGVVIGEDEDIESKKNTIYTDEYGRVKVRINLYAAQEDIDEKQGIYHYTPFLRVASPIASNHSGFYHTPRVGDEVIVSFFDEDIDKPYISGSLYNQSNPALPPLPLNAHQTSLSARTLNNSSALQAENTNSHHNLIESGFNEITLSNLKEQEHIYLQAQRDYEELIKHNFTQKIHNNKDSIVEGAYNERIKKIHTQTIDLAKIVSIGGEYNTNVALSKDTIVGLSHTLNVGVDNKVRIAKKSSEYVGEDKEVEIQGNLNTSIEQDESRNVGGNKREVVEGDSDISINQKLNIQTQGKIAIHSNENIHLSSPQSLSLESETAAIMVADNVTMIADSNYTLNANTEATIQVSGTSITAKGDCVIIKAGGVEVVIDSKGLVVKGGEVKSE